MKKETVFKALKVFVWYWLPAILFGGFIIFLSTRPDLKSSLPTRYDLVVRKIGHMAIYGAMTLLLARIGLREVKDKSVRLAAIFFGGLGALILAFTDENIQTFVPGRSGSVRDVGFDLVGIVAAVGALFFWNNKKKNKS